MKVDVGVRLDVYQKTAPNKAKDEQSNLAVSANRRLRSGQIQQLKNGPGRRARTATAISTCAILRPTRSTSPTRRESWPPRNADRSFLYLANAQARASRWN